MRRALELLTKLIYQEGDYVFFVCTPEAHQRPRPCPDVEEYTRVEDLPRADSKLVFPQRLLNVMFHRMRAGRARLYCWRSDEGELAAYSWAQDWAPFRRKYSVVSKGDGLMFGPDFTFPKYRGRGLHGRLLQHRIAVAPPGTTIHAFTAPDNLASQKGLVRSGFVFSRALRVQFFLRLFSKATERDWSPPKALADSMERAEAARSSSRGKNSDRSPGRASRVGESRRG